MGHTTEDQPHVDVLVVGAGPAGLTLAAELLLNDVSVRVIDRRDSPMSESRAIGLTIGALEHFLRRGQFERLQVGNTRQEVHFAGFPITTESLPTRLAPAIDIPQHRTEATLLAWVEELGGKVERGLRLTDIEQQADSVTCTVADRSGTLHNISAQFVAGCDGSRSTVRALSGLQFEPSTPAIQMLLGDFVGTNLPSNPFGTRNRRGMVMSGPVGDGAVRVIAAEFGRPFGEHGASISADEIAESYTRIMGSSFTWEALRWGSSFTDAAGVADRLVNGRVIILGDAARTHLPAGGQGMNTAILDAANLGWRLNNAIKQRTHAPLQGFNEERLAASHALITNTQAQGQLFLRGQEVDALREVFGRLLHASEGSDSLAREVSSIGVQYALEHNSADPSLGLPLLSGHLPQHGWAQLLAGLQRNGEWLYIYTASADLPTTRQAHAAGIRTLAASLVRVDEAISGTFRTDVPRDSVLVRPDGVIAWTNLSPIGFGEMLETLNFEPITSRTERS